VRTRTPVIPSLRAAHIGIEIAAHHQRLLGGDAEIGQGGLEQRRGRLAHDRGLDAGGGLDAEEEGTHVQRRAGRRLEAGVAMQRQQGRTALDRTEGAIELGVAGRRSGAAEKHHVDVSLGYHVDALEICTHVAVVHHQNSGVGAVVSQVTRRSRNRRVHRAGTNIHAGVGQQLRHLGPGA
jgi:hypothetical protein